MRQYLETDGSNVIELVWAGVAGAAGIARYFHELQRSRDPFRFFTFFAKFMVAAMSGWTFRHVGLLMSDNVNFVIVCTSVGGWVGADGIEFVWQKVIVPRLLRLK